VKGVSGIAGATLILALAAPAQASVVSVSDGVLSLDVIKAVGGTGRVVVDCGPGNDAIRLEAGGFDDPRKTGRITADPATCPPVLTPLPALGPFAPGTDPQGEPFTSDTAPDWPTPGDDACAYVRFVSHKTENGRRPPRP
jgi:hypothetical protein